MDYPRKLAECYQKDNKHEQANKVIQDYMGFNYDLNEVVKNTENMIGTAIVESKYLWLDGNNNDGLIEHTQKNDNKKYLTKLTQAKHNRMERLFHTNIYKYYPEIKKITPRLINFMEIEKLILITMEKVEKVDFEVNKKTIKQIGKISKVISSIKYKEVQTWFSFEFEKENHSLIDLLGSFNLIHEEFENKRQFKFIYNKMEKLNYSRKSVELIKRLEKVIIESKLYRKIDPLEHYSIRHGDFFLWNLLNEKKSGKIYVIDWGLMRIGPSWCDMAGFLGEIRYPFHKIQSDYLMNNEVSDHMEPIEKLFFIYTLVMVWITEFKKKEFENGHDIYLNPAIRFIEIMANDIIDNDPKQTDEIQFNHLKSNISI